MSIEWQVGLDIAECDSISIVETWKRIGDDGTYQMVSRRVGNLPEEKIADGPRMVYKSMGWK